MRRWVLAAALVSLLSGAFGLAPTPARAQPNITVYRDSYGVPHIEAPDLQGLSYATGYVTATDRLLEMDVIRRLGEGRLSEIFGDLELKADQMTRREFLNQARLQQQYDALDPRTRSMFDAYTKGVNDGAALTFNNPATRPSLYTAAGVTSFDPWKPLDTLAVDMAFTEVTFGGEGAAGELDNAAELQKLQAKYGAALGLEMFNDLYPPTFRDAPTVIAPGEGPPDPGNGVSASPYAVAAPNPAQQTVIATPHLAEAAQARASYLASVKGALDALHIPVPHIGSYAAAVSGKRSASGGALLMGSPQSGMLSPPIFYEIGWHLPGVTDCEGFTVPGLGPAVGVGWCNQHAWTLVAGNMGDQADLYVEKLNPQNPHQYWFNGAWRDMTAVPTTYHSGGLPTCGTGPPVGCPPHDTTETNYYTTHGFVFQFDTTNHVGFAYRRAQAGVFLRSLSGTIAWNMSRSMDVFQRGTDAFTASYNLIYTDDKGHIAYRFTGLQPVRPGTDRRFPMPGTGEAEWQGYLTQCQMPHAQDPAAGYFAVNQGIESKSIGWWPNSSWVGVGVMARLGHDQQLLSSLHGASMQDLASLDRPYLEGDDPYAAMWYPLIAHALQATSPSDPMAAQLQAALGYLDAWRADGFRRSEKLTPGKEDHVGLSLFEMDNFGISADVTPASAQWLTPLADRLTAQLEQQVFGSSTDHLHNTPLANSSVVYDALTGRTAKVHIADPDGFVRTAVKAVLQRLAGAGAGNFNTSDMSKWHRDFPSMAYTAIGLGTFTSAIPGFPASAIPPPTKGWDHGSYSQVIDMGAGTGENVEPQGNVAHDSLPDQTQESAFIASGGVVPPPPNWEDQHDLYSTYSFKPMLQRRSQYTAQPAQTLTLDDGGTFGSDTSVPLYPGDSCRLGASTVGPQAGAQLPPTLAGGVPEARALGAAATVLALAGLGVWRRRRLRTAEG